MAFNELRVVVSQIKCHATKLEFYKIVVCLVKSESRLWNFWYDWIKSAAICFVLTLYNYSVVWIAIPTLPTSWISLVTLLRQYLDFQSLQGLFLLLDHLDLLNWYFLNTSLSLYTNGYTTDVSIIFRFCPNSSQCSNSHLHKVVVLPVLALPSFPVLKNFRRPSNRISQLGNSRNKFHNKSH